jgi:hypothetical protein
MFEVGVKGKRLSFKDKYCCVCLLPILEDGGRRDLQLLEAIKDPESQ